MNLNKPKYKIPADQLLSKEIRDGIKTLDSKRFKHIKINYVFTQVGYDILSIYTIKPLSWFQKFRLKNHINNYADEYMPFQHYRIFFKDGFENWLFEE